MKKIIYNGQEMTLLTNDEYDYLLREIDHLRTELDDFRNNHPVDTNDSISIRHKIDEMCYLALLMQNVMDDINMRVVKDIELDNDHSKMLYDKIKSLANDLKESLNKEDNNV